MTEILHNQVPHARGVDNLLARGTVLAGAQH
jgi:hypothetical protein